MPGAACSPPHPHPHTPAPPETLRTPLRGERCKRTQPLDGATPTSRGSPGSPPASGAPGRRRREEGAGRAGGGRDVARCPAGSPGRGAAARPRGQEPARRASHSPASPGGAISGLPSAQGTRPGPVGPEASPGSRIAPLARSRQSRVRSGRGDAGRFIQAPAAAPQLPAKARSAEAAGAAPGPHPGQSPAPTRGRSGPLGRHGREGPAASWGGGSPSVRPDAGGSARAISGHAALGALPRGKLPPGSGSRVKPQSLALIFLPKPPCKKRCEGDPDTFISQFFFSGQEMCVEGGSRS